MRSEIEKPPGIRNSLISAAGSMLRPAFRSAGPTSSASPSPRSILVIKLCCIGDVLMATPTLRALRQRFPEAHIAMMVSSWAKVAVQNNPNLDEVVDCGPVEEISKPLTYFSLLRTVKRRRFDCCLVLERSPRLTVFPFLAGIPEHSGLDSFGRGFALRRRVLCDRLKPEVELYLDVARELGCEPESPWLEFHPTATDREVAGRLLESLGLPGEGPLVAVHVGGGSNPGMELAAKRWPPERFAALADRLVEERGATVLVLGAAKDRPIAGKVLAETKHELVDLVGRLDIGEVAALCGHCSLYIGNDTGVTHLAAAVGAPVVAIYGPSSPVMYKPYGPRTETVWRDAGCNPCFRFGTFNRECHEIRCIEAVTVDDVWEAAERLLHPPPNGKADG